MALLGRTGRLGAAIALAIAAAAIHLPPRGARAESAGREAGGAEKKNVEILTSAGAVDGPRQVPGEEGRLDRVRLELRVANHLSSGITDLVVEVTLVSAQESDEEGPLPIAGWKFEQSFSDVTIPAQDETYLRIARPLPARRQPLRADQIAYQVRILGYRLDPPELPLATKLLMSPEPGDQLAAISSYDPEPDSFVQPLVGESAPPASGGGAAQVDEEAKHVAAEIRRALTDLPESPSPSDALQLLLAIRAAGSSRDPAFVGPLLTLPDRITKAFGAALAELGARMTAASERDEPRLALLPRALRDPSHAHPEEAVRDAVREAIVRTGDAGVPELVRTARRDKAQSVRARASALLLALGRTTVRSQLALGDRAARLRVIEVFGEIGSEEPVAALSELAISRDSEMKKAALASLHRIGPAAIPRLVDTLGTPDRKAREALVKLIEEIAAKSPAVLSSQAERYGLEMPRGATAPALAKALAEHLTEAASARWATELLRGLELGRQGRYDEAFRILDGVYAADPDLYMRHAEPIARTYLRRAQDLHARGNYDAAIDVLRVGQSVKVLEEAASLLVHAQLALARGFLDLDELDKAQEALDGVDLAGEAQISGLKPIEIAVSGVSMIPPIAPLASAPVPPAPQVGPSDPPPSMRSPSSSEDPEVRALRARVLARRAELAYARGDFGKARSFVDRARALAPGSAELTRAHRRLLVTENIAIVIVLSLMVPGAALFVVLLVRRRSQAARMRRIASAIDRGDRGLGS